MLTFCVDTAWERIPASDAAKDFIWGLEGDRYSMTSLALRQYGEGAVSIVRTNDLRDETRLVFMAMDLFFVKVGLHVSLCRMQPD